MSGGDPLDPGVWAVVATPFHPDLSVDLPSLRRLVTRYADCGVVGLTVLGVFGEAAALDRAERDLVLRTVIEVVDLPLVVGLTSLTTAPAIQEATDTLAVAGDRATALMVQVNSSNAGPATAHLQSLVDAADRPVVIQDYPVASGVSVSISALRQIVGDVSRVAAVKAEAPPTPPAIAELADLGVPIFGGLGGIGLLDELEAGSAGAMTGFSFPEALLACVSAHRRGGYPEARAAYAPYLPLVNFEQQAKIALAIRKECLRRRGLIDCAAVRPPAAALPPTLSSLLGQQVAAAETILATTGS